MFTPLAITGCFVKYPGEEFELLERDLLRLDPQLVVQLPLSRPLDAQDGSIQLSTSLPWDSQRVRAAGVGPLIGEGNLLGSALLEEKAVVGVEEEDGKGAVEESSADVVHYMASLLACTANGLVVLIHDDAHLVHQADLFLIVPGEVAAVARGGGGGWKDFAGQRGVDLGEEGRDVVGSDAFRSRHGGCSAHYARIVGMED